VGEGGNEVSGESKLYPNYMSIDTTRLDGLSFIPKRR